MIRLTLSFFHQRLEVGFRAGWRPAAGRQSDLAAEVIGRGSPYFIGLRGPRVQALFDEALGRCCFRLVTIWVTSLGWVGEAGIFASLPFHPSFRASPNGPLRLSPPQVHPAVHNSGEKKFPKAVECLEKDRKVLLAFYDFPAEHWGHLRTTNPIESTFATVRLRQRRTKGCGSREASLTMVFMLARQAERHWRRLNGSEVIVHVLDGKEFKDGLMVQENAA